MVVTSDRLAYSGLLGRPSQLRLGAVTLYIAVESPFLLSLGRESPQRALLALVHPDEEHAIATTDRLVRKILLEPETVILPLSFRIPERTAITETDQYCRLRDAFDALLGGPYPAGMDREGFDRLFFGESLAPRALDPRIERVVQQIRSDPFVHFPAVDCARLTGLSYSRFLHLFKQEIGIKFRTFCAWKRARTVLPAIAAGYSLTRLALDAGYPDSTHFSHSIRRIYGLRPRDIVVGSKRLALYCEDAGPAAVDGFRAAG